MTALDVLPRSGDANEWSDQEKALVEAAGLVSKGRLAPRPTVEAFLHHCRRTGLDPIARQIYAIERGGKWGIQVSIDGARLVAERSREYRGQTPVQWTADGVTWVDVWLAKEHPAAARVGVYREGFEQALVAVATWDQYNAGGPMWQKMPALMLAKCAEMLALRKAFPQDLSGLYSAEEMDQASGPRNAGNVRQEVMEASPAGPSREEVEAYLLEVARTEDMQVLRDLYRRAETSGWMKLEVDSNGTTVEHLLWERKRQLEQPPARVEEEPVEADLVEQAGEA